jgi:outer membrane protein assembly factor BamD
VSNGSRAYLTIPIVALLGCVGLLWGCSPIPEFGEATAEDAYFVGAEALEREDYLLAIEAFNHVTMSSPLSDWADDALIGLGDAHRAISDYALAEDEYRRVLSDYPRSPLVPEAFYKLGLSYYDQSLPAQLDQTMTLEAIAQFERFVEAYPESDLVPDAREKIDELRARLAEKAYGAAMLYQGLRDPQAARVYLEGIVEDYPDTEWAPKSLLEIARSHALEGAAAKASEAYDRLIELYPGTEEAAAARAEKGQATP